VLPDPGARAEVTCRGVFGGVDAQLVGQALMEQPVQSAAIHVNVAAQVEPQSAQCAVGLGAAEDRLQRAC
jgi:hypothetical protein